MKRGKDISLAILIVILTVGTIAAKIWASKALFGDNWLAAFFLLGGK